MSGNVIAVAPARAAQTLTKATSKVNGLTVLPSPALRERGSYVGFYQQRLQFKVARQPFLNPNTSCLFRVFRGADCVRASNSPKTLNLVAK